MAFPYREVDLLTFVEECKSQTVAADLIGCSQGNISQALADIKDGSKRVAVRVFEDGRVEADIIKPFGKQRSAA